MNDILRGSWGAFPESIARKYLKSFGNPSEDSKRVLYEVLKGLGPRPMQILDLGCGNANLAEYLFMKELPCSYTGVDFSEVLLSAAREACPQATFIQDDVNVLESVQTGFDVAIYSHVLEILPSPESSLTAARRVAKKIVVRFFEPPAEGADWVELREMDVGSDVKVPYLRRRMSQSFYEMVLSRIGCKEVDVYRTDSKDQIHVLHF